MISSCQSVMFLGFPISQVMSVIPVIPVSQVIPVIPVRQVSPVSPVSPLSPVISVSLAHLWVLIGVIVIGPQSHIDKRHSTLVSLAKCYY